ncbi:hypothetical protein CEN49_21935 [Fischerella thermalis CCMEE 5273]|jgi:hypothetical protein|nr:hypothetical protein CEN49_21935 [Fischerella thermalis CCMEE 5273]
MTYSKQLHPWCIIRVLPNKQQLDDTGVSFHTISVPTEYQESTVVARFRHRDDAVAYLQMLKKSSKNVNFLIIFDVQGVRD